MRLRAYVSDVVLKNMAKQNGELQSVVRVRIMGCCVSGPTSSISSPGFFLASPPCLRSSDSGVARVHCKIGTGRRQSRPRTPRPRGEIAAGAEHVSPTCLFFVGWPPAAGPYCRAELSGCSPAHRPPAPGAWISFRSRTISAWTKPSRWAALLRMSRPLPLAPTGPAG